MRKAGPDETERGDIEDDERHVFVHGNICDAQLVAKLIADYDPDYIIIEFTAERGDYYRYDGKGALDAEEMERTGSGKDYENGYLRTHPSEGEGNQWAALNDTT